MYYFNCKFSLKTSVHHRSRHVSVKGLHNPLLQKTMHQVHKSKALIDEALTYTMTSGNGYIKMEMSFKQKSNPIHFKHST